MEKGYRALERQYEHVHELSMKQFSSECQLIEDAISFSFGLYFKLAKSSKLDEKAQHLAAFFYRNCIYLSASYQMIRKGMPDPAGNNLRTIFETIIWQYAYLSDEEIYENFKELTVLENEKIVLLPKKEWSNTKERKLENLRRKYNFQKMMKQLYSKELFEKFFFNQYWMLSHKSHSSLFGINYNTPSMEGKTTIEKSPKEVKDNLMAILYLTAENLICFLNCFSNDLSQSEIDSTIDFTNKINRSIIPALSLVPDKKKMEFTTRFKEV